MRPKYHLAFLYGMIFSFVLMGCAAFKFKYYGLAEVNYSQGMLLGPSAKDDLPFSKCEPSEQMKHPCVVMLTADYFAFRQDYEDIKNKLIECEKK